jgi:hypothetical protein
LAHRAGLNSLHPGAVLQTSNWLRLGPFVVTIACERCNNFGKGKVERATLEPLASSLGEVAANPFMSALGQKQTSADENSLS